MKHILLPAAVAAGMILLALLATSNTTSRASSAGAVNSPLTIFGTATDRLSRLAGTQQATFYTEVNLNEDGSVVMSSKECGNVQAEPLRGGTAQPHKIVSFFMYNNEQELLYIRLTEHWNVVDYFLIIEARFAHQGRPKPLRLQPVLCQRFGKFASKIVHVILNTTDMPEHMWGRPQNSTWGATWDREFGSRNAMHAVMDRLPLQADDLVLQSDLDEIPSAIAIRLGANYMWNGLSKEGVLAPHVQFELSFYLNSLYHPKNGSQIWAHGELYRYGDTRFCTFQSLRRGWCSKPLVSIPNAGIHLTYAFPPEGILVKTQSFAHANDHPDRKPPSIEQIKTGIRAMHVSDVPPSEDLAVMQFTHEAYDLFIAHSSWLRQVQETD